MSRLFTRKGWVIIGAVVVIVLITAAGSAIYFNPRLTQYVESEQFRRELEKETAKGLHFPSDYYAPIRRTGFLTARSEGFHAEDGWKAMTAIDAHGLTTSFNPWGVFLRRWQLDDMHIQSGEVSLQTYEPKPEPSPAKPWFHIFLPNRVYLKQVRSEQAADVTWRLRNEKVGFFGTRLLITPHGRDFEYQAFGGTMKMAFIPDLHLRHTHLLITKTLLTLYDLDLTPQSQGDGFVHCEGTAGTRDDRRVDFKINFEHLPVSNWLPQTWRDHFTGAAAGRIHWTGKDPKLESASGNATLQVHDARISQLPFLEKLAAITGRKSLEQLELSACAFELEWTYPKAAIKELTLEEKGKFRVEGSVQLEEKSLGGTLKLGVTREYLAWLPKAEEIFAREREGYLWTTVHLSGPINSPQQDLSPRILEVLKESPGASLGRLFRIFGEWLRSAFGAE
jgi:hypothetical protein